MHDKGDFFTTNESLAFLFKKNKQTLYTSTLKKETVLDISGRSRLIFHRRYSLFIMIYCISFVYTHTQIVTFSKQAREVQSITGHVSVRHRVQKTGKSRSLK